MRYSLFALFLVASATTSASQAAQPPQEPPRADMWVNLRTIPGSPYGAAHGVLKKEMYLGGGWIGMGTSPVTEGTSTAARMFRVRAWKEGTNARIVVYAVLEDGRSPKGETETPIKTVALGFGESVDVTETQDWGAKPFRLNVSREQYGE
jgi:hypothetical protein